MITKQFAEHVAHVADIHEAALNALADSGVQAEAVLIHSGTEHYYYGDDRAVPFQAYGHFLRWLHTGKPDQFILFRPGNRPTWFQVIPADYWYEQDVQTDPLWHEAFDVVRLTSVAELQPKLPKGRLLYCGEQESLAVELGIPEPLINPAPFIAFLDFHRACKTDYELAQLREANRLALIGHGAARDCFLAGGSEYDIHSSYLGACKLLEDETPYTNIVALDDKAAFLHYQNKRRVAANHSQVLLIDAGYRVRGYGSDITRTWARDNAHGVFRELLAGMEQLQMALVDEVQPQQSYIDIHLSALRRLAALLTDLDICRGASDDLLQAQVPQLFMPHGVGHLLGVNVHDVGGHQQDVSGARLAPPAHTPMLRNTRVMTVNMVFTIEPGCYFIPLLLEPERQTPRGRLINWTLVDELYPLGGIRIEDNVRVTETGSENLTRAPLA